MIQAGYSCDGLSDKEKVDLLFKNYLNYTSTFSDLEGDNLIFVGDESKLTITKSVFYNNYVFDKNQSLFLHVSVPFQFPFR